MLRILADVNIYGKKSALAPLAENSAIQNGELKQMGLLRKHPPPPVDSWVYHSKHYRFHWEKLDEELRDFLSQFYLLKTYKLNEENGIEYSLLSISPVEQSFEETFSCLLSTETLSLLIELGLSLEISPAVIMPEVPFWKPDTALYDGWRPQPAAESQPAQVGVNAMNPNKWKWLSHCNI